MGYKYDRDEILVEAVTAAYDDGLSRLTFGRLAKRLGISDRSIVYYFPTKADLVGATVAAIGDGLIGVLESAFGAEPLPADDLARRAWPIMRAPEHAATFGVFFEMVGLSAAGLAPYDELAPLLIDGWAVWLAPRVDAPEDQQRAEALRIMALLDGLLLLQSQLGSDAADAAAVAAGVADETLAQQSE